VYKRQALDCSPEVVPSSFKCSFADCFDLYFTGTGGARIHAKLLKPRHTEVPRPALLHFHGYSGASSEWTFYLPFVAEGFVVAALDCRGQGGKSEDVGGVTGPTLRGHIIRGLSGEPENLYYRHVFLDTVILAKIVMGLPEVDAHRVGAYGASQGGGLSLACSALTPSVRKVAATYPFLSDYQRVWQMDLAKDAYWELQDYFRKHDPLHQKEEAVFRKLGYIDVQHLAPRIRAEVLMPIGLMDTVCPPSTQFAAFNKITSKKEILVFPDFGHESLPNLNDILHEYLVNM